MKGVLQKVPKNKRRGNTRLDPSDRSKVPSRASGTDPALLYRSQAENLVGLAWRCARLRFDAIVASSKGAGNARSVRCKMLVSRHTRPVLPHVPRPVGPGEREALKLELKGRKTVVVLSPQQEQQSALPSLSAATAQTRTSDRTLPAKPYPSILLRAPAFSARYQQRASVSPDRPARDDPEPSHACSRLSSKILAAVVPNPSIVKVSSYEIPLTDSITAPSLRIRN
ncbi:uncharacterized protein PAN0_005d2610 [Moesziomyces antarcticus]|uniref:Uncharacterized protein n=1 Tax=Pseudozyma antarctica TaxID=84753 RepID=A0A081CCK1_PSEA2|nr:uncharacterized protein PAN0_005d2610 [Moesziomyces antarcticus]GAK64397.1 hypothetical protein PAN0_005d2610 [Moesziomyces antarcticus]